MSSTQNWLTGLLGEIRRARVIVFGDFALDAYWMIDDTSTEQSIETGLPVHRVRTQRYSPGGAGNVAANLAALQVAAVRAIGLVGDDLFGHELRQQLAHRRIDTSGMIASQPDWNTCVYAKPCVGSRELNRLDFGAFNELSPATLPLLMDNLRQAVTEADAVVINQQLPNGICGNAVIEQLNQIIADHPNVPFIVDARDKGELFRGAILKVNQAEAARLLQTETGDARRLAADLAARTGKTVFLTRGDRGLLVQHQGESSEIPGIQVLGETDTVGAGDTVVAALAAALGVGATALQAARFANVAASITIQKLNTTGTASPDEIQAVGPEPDYIYHPELATDSRHARFIPGTHIEIVRPLTDRPAIRHAIFDHDGTLSTLREGWEQIMEPMMVRAILGTRYSDIDDATYQRVLQSARRFIDQTTGIQTLVQMQGLAKLVRQFGFVPAADVLDEHGYKKIYNDLLLARVNQNRLRVEQNELASVDYQIKNAEPLLQRLYARGVKLYLASGTDVGDVIAEATAMGYAHLFEGRIYGAVGDVNVEAKKIVLEKIIGDNNLHGHEFATFGDGPVEMRETRKRGGICVGVASDEPRRYGLNATKRTRLIRAGADLIVPDFSQLDALLKYLNLD